MKKDRARVEPRNRRRIVVSSMAQEGHGKTNFLLTMPQPLLIVSCDPNTRDVIEKVWEKDVEDIPENELRLVEVPFPAVGFETDEEEIKKDAQDAWDLLTDTLSDVILDKCDTPPRSVGLDTGSELNELNILETFGRTDKISPEVRRIRMGNLNSRFKGLFRGLEKVGVHVGVSHRVKDHYETKTIERRSRHGRESVEESVKVEGVFDRIGFKQIGNLVNTEVLMLFDPTKSDSLAGKFGMRVTRCMIRPGLVGEEYWGRERFGERKVHRASFPYLATLLYPQTSIDDWM